MAGEHDRLLLGTSALPSGTVLYLEGLERGELTQLDVDAPAVVDCVRTFELPGASVEGLAVGDIDGDGQAEVAVAEGAGVIVFARER